MKKILLLGAGRSAFSLINYLIDNCAKEGWEVTIADMLLAASIKSEKRIQLDIQNETLRASAIQNADLVISLLPPSLHYIIALDCIRFKKHLLTASYVAPEIAALDKEAKAAGVLFLNEMGLDPGIDHMSAMAILDEIKARGGTITSYKSYTGGLIAPESSDNPWEYKFTWNPRNVVLAGQATAQYLENKQLKYVPYNRLFKQVEDINIEGVGRLEGYPNRDSLHYKTVYGLTEAASMLRGTLRPVGFCKAWNVFVQLGWTDDTIKIDSDVLSYTAFIEAFLPAGSGTIEARLAAFTGETTDSTVFKKLKWLGIFGKELIQLGWVSPAFILQHLLEKKWSLRASDKDRIVMQHLVKYTAQGASFLRRSSLIVTGHDALDTAMAKTVGLPLGIAAKLILNNTIRLTGVQIPVLPEIYLPVLLELKSLGVSFVESEKLV
jgi:saccharopine dehydrogenase-like NADP-dependent oxidoreductase